MERVILVHYSEIGLKGKNRPFFERILKENLHRLSRKEGGNHPRKGSGHIVVPLPAGADVDGVADRLSILPGIAWLAPALPVPTEMEAIREAVLELVAKDGDGTFRIDARRSNKGFPLTSMDINREIGAAVAEATSRPVDLGSPEDTYGIEVSHEASYVYSRRRRGIGGLPVGVSGTIISLMSGGIDSPVAAWKMMRRGCRVTFVHFFGDTQERSGVREKIGDLVEILSRTQGPSCLHVVPFGGVQRKIIQFVPAKYRMLVYRRTMFRMAEPIRRKENAAAYVTGDSVGQVASQTLANLHVIQKVSPVPVLCPLAGENKEKIVEIARQIGTFETSTLPYQDCCSFLIAAHPVTRATLEEMEGLETFDMEEEIREALEGTEIISLA